MFVLKSTMEYELEAQAIRYNNLEKDLKQVTRKLQQVQLDHTLEICPIGTKLKHIKLDITIVRIEVTQDGEVSITGEYNKEMEVQEIELSLELIKALKP